MSNNNNLPQLGELVTEKNLNHSDNEEEDDEDDEEEWFYEDKSGQTNGPFPESHLKKQLFSGKINENLKIKKELDDEFVTIKELQPRFYIEVKEFLQRRKQSNTTNITNITQSKSNENIQSTKISQSGETQTLGDETTTWMYIDMQGKEHGPYSNSEMRVWYSMGYFPPITLVKPSTQKDYFPISAKLCCFTIPLPEDLLQQNVEPVVVVVNETNNKTKKNESNQINQSDQNKKDETKEEKKEPQTQETCDLNEESHQWYYIDLEGKEQGPWSTTEMRGWYFYGLFSPELKVRTSVNVDYQPINKKPRVFMIPVPSYSDTSYYNSSSVTNAPSQSDFDDYYQFEATYNPRLGKLTVGGASHWERKGLPSDRQGRQLQHYFDFDNWQERQRTTKKRKPN